MALDDTLPRNMNVSSKDRGAVGCTSIFVNQPNVQVKYNAYIIIMLYPVPSEFIS